MGEIDVKFWAFLKSYYGWRWRKFPFFEFFLTVFLYLFLSSDFDPKAIACDGFSMPVGEFHFWSGWDIEQLRAAYPHMTTISYMLNFIFYIYYIFLYRLTLPLLLLANKKKVYACRRKIMGGLFGITSFGQITQRDDQVYLVEYNKNLKWYRRFHLFKYLPHEHLLPPEVAEGIKNNSPENHEFDFVLNGKKCHFKVFNIE